VGALHCRDLLTVGFAIAFVSGYALYTDGLITIGTVYLIINYTQLFARPIRELTQQVENLQNVGASLERVEDLLSISPTIVDGPGTKIPAGPLSLQFNQIAFGYNDKDVVLQEISFEVRPSEVLGLLGRTGSGKTTLTRLVFRLYSPTAGNICLGGVDIAQPTLHSLRQLISDSDVQLFEAVSAQPDVLQ
jgi:ATP-binding cassette subfamily B protein